MPRFGSLLFFLLAASAAVTSAACSATPGDALGTTSDEQGTCASGKHECAAWGATCNGTTLETCVLAEDGCRRLVAQPCSLGCDAGACKTCDALTVPKRGSSLATPTAFYQGLVTKGNVAIASWTARNHEYTEKGRGLTAVDLTNPDAPVAIATTPLADNESALTLRIDGDRLLGIIPGSRVQIWDATNPSSLSPLGSYVPAAPAKSLAVAGGVAYVGTSVGVDVVDVSNAASPQLLSVVATSVPAGALAVSGTRLAVAGGTEVEIVDVTDKTQPQLLSKASITGTIYGDYEQPLAFDGQRAVVAATSSYNQAMWTALSTFDVGADGTLTRRGGLGGLPYATSLSLTGTDVTLSTGSGVATVDLSDVSAPKWKKHVFLGSEAQRARSVARIGDHLYASGTEGVTAIDLTKASDVTLLSGSGRDWLAGAATKGSLAYLVRTQSGLVIEDVRDPKSPVVLSQTKMNATSIALDGFLAYVAVRDEGLRIYDIRSPWKPELVGQVSAPMVGQVSVHAGRAYAMCGIGYTCIFDVSQPAAPTLITTSDAIVKTTSSSSAWRPFAMRGAHLYLPSADKLVIVDLSNATAPVKIGEASLGSYAYNGEAKIAFRGDHAFVAYDCYSAATDTCLAVVDVSNPANPQKVGSAVWQFAMNGGFYQTLNASPRLSTMHVSGHHLFLTNQWGGVLVMDVSNPLDPKHMGELWTSLPGREHFVSERFLTVYTEASFPFPAPEQARDQVIELCK